MKYTLGKIEKLKSRTAIQDLFSEGKRINAYPLQLIYLPYSFDDNALIKAGFSVPKRNIKLAVHRNRIKRVLREVYRLNKQLFIENIKTPSVFMFIFMAKEEINYEDLTLAFKTISAKYLIKIKEDEQN
ncbi:ribonuclease P protein component [Lutibacter sp.]|uniref:ribonuclease P protein component n=1 Tax=Lutibacter sp. TaxID=1925666 RepID=UPI002735662C|nr:ribonuclease P protein component [Lutibacter sp.]MDP3313852.1 ribonuclease P protein component [Lutibacter sp.]